MENRNKAEQFWDRTANMYDAAEKRDEDTYLNLIERTRKHLRESDVVLDFGCGTGLVSNEIACNVERVQAIDISSKMIEIARNKAIRLNIQNVDFNYTNLFDDRLEMGSFDVILAFHILHLVDDPKKVIQRLNELLKPGGLIISATPCMGEKPLLNGLFSIGSKLGIIPKIKAFRNSELKSLILKENFEFIESDLLKPNSPQYFLVVRKLNGV